MNKPMTKKPNVQGEFMKYVAAHVPKLESWIVFTDNVVIEKNLSEDSANKLAQFLNSASYLSESPKERAKRSERINFDFDLIYQMYPRHDGKRLGIERLRRTIKTVEKYNLLTQAVQNYAEQMSSTEKRFIKHFSTWVNCWTDSLPEDAHPNENSQISIDEINSMMGN